MSDWILKTEGLCFHYGKNTHKLMVLDHVDFMLKKKEHMAIVGDSGVGKSTLLHLLGLLDRPTSGDLFFTDHKHVIQTSTLSDSQRTALRCHLIGMIYQAHHLLAEFTSLENVMMPMLIAGQTKNHAKERARYLLNQVGLSGRESHRPTELSGGQQQRVSIARALANHPKILLADEPTGNLDEKNSLEIFALFDLLCQKEEVSIVMSTHNVNLAKRLDRVLHLKQGKLQKWQEQ